MQLMRICLMNDMKYIHTRLLSILTVMLPSALSFLTLTYTWLYLGSLRDDAGAGTRLGDIVNMLGKS